LLAEGFGEELEVGLVVQVATVVAELEGGVEGVLDAGSELGGDGVPAECQLQALGRRALAGGEQGGRLFLPVQWLGAVRWSRARMRTWNRFQPGDRAKNGGSVTDSR
jgi:hypothetical protein